MKTLLSSVAKFSLTSALFMAPMASHAWTTVVDCEGGTLNTLPANTSVAYWGNNTRLNNTQFSGGKQSCKFSIKQGSEGWPSTGGPLEWGGIFSFPAKVPVGGEVWARVSMWVPTTFPISTNTGMLKFLRMHTGISTRGTGCIDFLMGDQSTPIWDAVARKDAYPPFVSNFEGAPGNTMIGTTAESVAKGKWETYEIYVKVDSVAASNGGTSILRVWKNNNLIANLKNQVTAVDKTGYVDSLYMFTYWNGNAPSDAYVYMDDLIMTSDKPSNVDANGYPFIGGALVDGAAPPSPPVLTVTPAT